MTAGWKIWTDLTNLINWYGHSENTGTILLNSTRFEIDDIFQRISVLFYLVCLFGFTTNISYFFQTTYTSAIGFYIAQRLFAGTWFLFVATILPTIRGMLVYNCLSAVVSCSLWIASMRVAWPNQLILIFLALTVDLCSHSFMWLIFMPRDNPRSPLRHILKYFEFLPAINIEHRVQRNSSFVALVRTIKSFEICSRARSCC